MCGGPVSTAEAKKREADYRAEDDHRTLTRAEEVRADKTRMAGVIRHHRKQTSALRKTSKALFGSGRRPASRRA